jgi:hypothetical protein
VRRRGGVPWLHVAFATFLFALGGWYAVTGRARFELGGDDLSNRHPIHVDARGLDAVAIGFVFAGLGLVILAVGVRGEAGRRFFWAGAAVLAATVLYGVVNVVRAVIGLFT